jgi:hypothetical protein
MVFVGAGDGEVAGGEHGQDDVGVSGPAGADLVVVEADFVLRDLEASDRPPGAGNSDQLAQRRVRGSGAAVVGPLGHGLASAILASVGSTRWRTSSQWAQPSGSPAGSSATAVQS